MVKGVPGLSLVWYISDSVCDCVTCLAIATDAASVFRVDSPYIYIRDNRKDRCVAFLVIDTACGRCSPARATEK